MLMAEEPQKLLLIFSTVLLCHLTSQNSHFSLSFQNLLWLKFLTIHCLLSYQILPMHFCFISNGNGATSLNKCRKYGGMEVGLSMPKNKMDSFATIFNTVLRSLFVA